MTFAEQDQIAAEMERLENEIIFYKSKQANVGLTQPEWWCLQDAKKQLRQLRNIERK